MRVILCSVKLVIINEMSMVSNLTLSYIHLHMDELFGDLHAHQCCWGSDANWFGSVNMLFVGNLPQQPQFPLILAFAVTNKCQGNVPNMCHYCKCLEAIPFCLLLVVHIMLIQEFYSSSLCYKRERWFVHPRLIIVAAKGNKR